MFPNLRIESNLQVTKKKDLQLITSTINAIPISTLLKTNYIKHPGQVEGFV